VSILSEAFDGFAASYERFRPSYSAAVIERILAFAALAPNARLLELGCGTGKATLPFAELGHRILALEPGPNLAAIARQHLAQFQQVEIQTTSFEDWPLEAEAFDLVFAAQSFHWVAPAQRLPKCAGALRSRGALAIFGHAPDISADPAYSAIHAAYRKHAVALSQRDGAREWYRAETSPMLAQLQASAEFDDLHHEHFSWQKSLSAASYCDLLTTYSDHATLPAERRARLLAAVARAIDEHGGTITIDYRTGLFLARKVAPASP
jgi:trans-aconitate methyltransferase